MAAKQLTVSFDEKHNTIIFESDKGIKTIEKLQKPITLAQALTCVNREYQGRESVAQSTVSMMVTLLQSPRLGSWAGKCDPLQSLPAEFKAAIRDLEVETYKPAFVAGLLKKGAKEETAEAQWQALAQDMRKGGSYAQAKGKIIAYFAYTGKLPCVYVDGIAQTDRQYTVAAVEKLLQNIKAAAGPVKEDRSIAARLMKLAHECDNFDEKTEFISDDYGYASAIAACRQIMARFEGLQREAAERGELNPSGVVVAAAKVVSIAAKTEEPALL